MIEPTFFQWCIDDNNSEIVGLIKEIANAFVGYSTETLKMSDIGESDMLKDLYQSLSPRALRHALGEYYTPDWLSDLVFDRVGYNGAVDLNILDPTCGSGTFLVGAIKRYKGANSSKPAKELTQGIISHIRGIDLNPLAVTASKINYLIAIGGDLIKSLKGSPIEIPVYLSDAMLAPLEHKYETGPAYIIPTKVADFTLPKAFVEDSRFLATMTIIDEAVRQHWTPSELKGIATSKLHWDSWETDQYLIPLFEILVSLDNRGLNGVWASIIKNFFAPSFMAQVDYIIGNPPWVNWENLPESYRESIKRYWSAYAYNLFRHKGLKARLGSAHDDICVLLTYIVCDVFLKDGGKIGFLLPQTLFKSKGGGEGFRAFQIPHSFSLDVGSADDLVDVKAFDAANKPSIFCARKGGQTKYPVRYYRWIRPSRIKVSPHHSLSDVQQLCSIRREIACPIDNQSITSPWLTGDRKSVGLLKGLVGKSGYRARKGVDTSLNAVFWVRTLEAENSLTRVVNCQTRTRSSVRQISFWIEDESLFPLLRGSDFRRWRYSIEYYQILLYNPKTGRPLSSEVAAERMPRAWAYFNRADYRLLLERRGIYSKHLQDMPVYSCYDIGSYSFTKQKVVWKALDSQMQAVVIGSFNSKVIIPDHNVMMIPIQDEDEAHYLCAFLNSNIATRFVTSYVEWFFSTHILDYFKIPRWDPKLSTHQQLSELSKNAHLLASTHQIRKIESELNRIVEGILNIKS